MDVSVNVDMLVLLINVQHILYAFFPILLFVSLVTVRLHGQLGTWMCEWMIVSQVWMKPFVCLSPSKILGLNAEAKYWRKENKKSDYSVEEHSSFLFCLPFQHNVAFCNDFYQNSISLLEEKLFTYLFLCAPKIKCNALLPNDTNCMDEGMRKYYTSAWKYN